MKDIISIDSLQVDTVIGVYARERNIKQTLFIDLELYKDLSLAASSDQLDHTLDYDQLTKDLVALISETSFKLIEALAEQVAEYILTNFGVAGLRITVHKPGAIALAKNVSVTLQRGESQTGVSS
ncbi:MAG: dihydroneopterin aldolase [Gammaproteobacteria bacterium]|jgi:7,8-dihydroneopterin aldolase/epimerase/oxygenase|nr:dihydroneopterin aldolase [Gammaproteobacteria bacterium]MBT5203812.1 dihydroneopterin aldolase [Gammaproteobacteria bacterium]MBT5603178.1 dihydroneopterin aldolase [Gammaproteobacteria bacterium]MBT6246209.1 dihydroneopterin aldolase [Gammaproteobacteria bacterium]